MYYFATLFDKNYLTRGLALYSSMQEHINDFALYVLALDNEVFKYIENKKNNNLKVIKLSDIENKYPELTEAKNNRSIVEYYFTLSPILPLYILETYSDIDFITTLDADIFFFSSPKPIFDKFKNYSILITKHDFAENISWKIQYGKYNVSFQSFRRNDEGFKCLNTWKKQCVNRCCDVLEGNKFADQKYLDNWAYEYSKVLEIAGEGTGVAPWNIAKYKIIRKNKNIYCNNSKLIFYHFHGLRYITRKLVKLGLNSYKVKTNSKINNYIYLKYIKKISSLNQKIKFNDKNIQRFNLTYSKKELIDLLIFGNNTFFNFLNLRLINIHLLPIFKFLKYTVFLPFWIIKKIFNKQWHI